MAYLVLMIRKLDLKQIQGKKRRDYGFFIALESLLLLAHVPPFRFGSIGAKEDLYNIYGVFKIYLLLELIKIKHPLWLRRYQVASSQDNVAGSPVFVGNFFCVSCLSVDYDLTCFYLLATCALVSLCAITVYFVERWVNSYNFSNSVDGILSDMAHVPRACHLPKSCNGYVAPHS